jgi:squalene-hopene cyclase-like protein
MTKPVSELGHTGAQGSSNGARPVSGREPRPRGVREALRMARPAHVTTLLRDVAGVRRPVRDSAEHLREAMAWLCRAQDAGRVGGVAAEYSLIRGWEPPYPETTGYIIPTFLDYARLTDTQDFRDRAVRMGEWLLGIQMTDGSFQAGFYYRVDAPALPSVFNTGQILLGLCRLFRETLDRRWLAAAVRAGDWLVRMQAADGAWYQGLSFHGPTAPVRTYYVRVAWALMELAGMLEDGGRYSDAAARHVRWTLAQQQENGWFDNNAFEVGAHPFTHTIAYVLEGLLGYADHAETPACLPAVLKTATRLMRCLELRSVFPGEFGPDWQSSATYRCLTGEAQISGVWLRLYARTEDARFLNSALKLLDRVKATQNLTAANPGIRGGIKGSQPIWGRYHRLSFVNWGAKFLADALMTEIEAVDALEKRVLGR